MDPNDYAEVIAEPDRYFSHADPDIRRLAVSAVAAGDGHLDALVRLLSDDPQPRVRAEAAEALGRRGTRSIGPLLRATADPDPVVVEAVATALGDVADPSAVEWLMTAARESPDRLVREAAVAALGAIGHPAALPLLVELAGKAPPQVRRRSVVALTVFDGPEVEAAISGALADRNPMVREAAEMVMGRPFPDGADGTGGAS